MSRSRKVIVSIGLFLIVVMFGLSVVRAILPGGATSCSQECSERALNYRYTAPVVGYRNHVVQAEKCECI